VSISVATHFMKRTGKFGSKKAKKKTSVHGSSNQELPVHCMEGLMLLLELPCAQKKAALPVQEWLPKRRTDCRQ